MADNKSYIIPDQRTATAGIKEKGSNFTCPVNTVMSMRIITVLLFAFLWATDVCGQSASPIDVNTCMIVDNADIQYEKNSFDYKQTVHWKLYKELKVAGWTSVGVGGAMLIAGFIGDIFDNYERGCKEERIRFRVVWCMGAGIAAASVPLLTFAYINRHKAKKAAAISLTASRLSVDLPTGGRQSRSTLGISINF